MNYLNRKKNPLPLVETKMSILKAGNQIKGVWKPFNPNDYTAETMPSKGYLGTFEGQVESQINPKSIVTIGYHAWEQNNFEFLMYKLI